ncbi:hypothetical protein BOV88_13435 [Solemya velum gill symbiont]|uniref:Uncharacterized protein n=1 Tax=Solemya velum gill symbiont TaxID=2340 RepID=A0A1T2CNL1_SOVGS|nr:hypothetical protein BOV88_13435 [Solemya velum gill symbiont]OOY36427.1 hypothetical protein BOV89_12630 [Solemya velum gill symbiont]
MITHQHTGLCKSFKAVGASHFLRLPLRFHLIDQATGTPQHPEKFAARAQILLRKLGGQCLIILG